MLKSKKALYVLLPLVAIIWGVIFYRIFSAVKPAEGGQKEVFFQAGFTSGPLSADTFNISADYRDPFLGKMTTTAENEKPKIPAVKKPQPKPEPVAWPAVVYKGMIRNQKSNKQLCLVSIAGQDNMMKVGDVYAEVELRKLFKDSIEVTYKNETKYFKK